MREWFDSYLAAFNRADHATLGTFYADDVAFFGQAAELHGREAVLTFYRMVWQRLDEKIELLDFVAAPSGDRLLAELHTKLIAHVDWPDMPTGAMRAGEQRRSINFVWYDVADHRFARIRSARLWPTRGT